MNVTFLQENTDFLIEHMRAHGYSVSYVKNCRSTSNYIIRLSSELSWESYDDVRLWCSTNEDFSEQYRENLQFSISILEQYDEEEKLPIHPTNQSQFLLPLHSAEKLDLFPIQERMAEFEKSMQDKGHKPEYIKSIKSTATKIIITARSIPWDSFQEIWNYYQSLDKSEHTKRMHRIAIKKMQKFLEGGRVPCHRNAKSCLEDAGRSLGQLDLYELKDRLPDLQKHMEDSQYSESYIHRVIIKIERIIVRGGYEEWNSYQDVMDWYDNQDYGTGFLGEIHTIIRLMSAFHLYNIYPNNRAEQHPLWPRKNMYQQLNQYYKEIVDYGCNVQEARGLKPSSVDRARSEATAFFYTMQERGIMSIESITEEDIIAFFHTNTVEKHRTKIPGLSLFMRDCIQLSPTEFRRIDSLLPITHNRRKNIQYLKSDECKAIQSALEDVTNDLSLKQRAIGTIFFYTGMRSSDVANLTLDSIDLKHQTIRFNQVKTGIPVVLPLLPVIGNAIYDYCSMERPKSKSPFLFLGDFAPYNPITSNALGWIVTKIMNRANVRQKEGDRKGTHIFRHRVTTVMAENNVPAPVISATLGHTSPKSLDAYLSADITHLRECAIDLSPYAMAEEVFKID